MALATGASNAPESSEVDWHKFEERIELPSAFELPSDLEVLWIGNPLLETVMPSGFRLEEPNGS